MPSNPGKSQRRRDLGRNRKTVASCLPEDGLIACRQVLRQGGDVQSRRHAETTLVPMLAAIAANPRMVRITITRAIEQKRGS